MTRTHTVYFTEDHLAEVTAAAAELEADLEKRRPHISDEAYSAAASRLGLIKVGIHLLREPVPESFA